jgi:hypothetical protein
LGHQSGYSNQLAPAGLVIQRSLFQSWGYHHACSHVSSRIAGKWEYHSHCSIWTMASSIIPSLIWNKWCSLDSNKPLIHSTARISHHPTFSSSAGSKANSRDDLSLKWRCFPSSQWNFGKSDNRHSQIRFWTVSSDWSK